MIKNLFGKMFSFLGKPEDMENQSEPEQAQSALETLVSSSSAEANSNNSASVGDDTTILENPSPNSSLWENIELPGSDSKQSTNAVQLGEDSPSTQKSQRKSIGKQNLEREQESADVGILPNVFLQQDVNLCEEVPPNDINISGEIPTHDFLKPSEVNSNEAIPADNFVKLDCGDKNASHEGPPVDMTVVGDSEIQPHNFLVSTVDKNKVCHNLQSNTEAGDEIGTHAFLQPNVNKSEILQLNLQQESNCNSNNEIPPPLWVEQQQTITTSTALKISHDATHEDTDSSQQIPVKSDKPTIGSPHLPDSVRPKEFTEKSNIQTGETTSMESTGPDSVEICSESTLKITKEVETIIDEGTSNDKGASVDLRTSTEVKSGQEKGKSCREKKKENWREKKKEQRNRGQREEPDRDSQDRQNRGPRDEKKREPQQFIEEPKDPQEYLSYVDKMTKAEKFIRAKDLIYKLGYIKDVDQSQLQEAVMKQYRFAASKRSFGWIKDAQYYCEILFPQEWIDENIVPIDGRRNRKKRDKFNKSKQRIAAEEEALQLSSGRMCRDIRLFTDPTLTVVKKNFGSGHANSQKPIQSSSAEVPSKASSYTGSPSKHMGLQDLEKLENFASEITSGVIEEAKVVALEDSVSKKEGETNGSEKKEKRDPCNKESNSSIKSAQDMDKSLKELTTLTPRRSGEELAIGFNYHSAVLAKDSPSLEEQPSEQDLPNGHTVSVEYGQGDSSSCLTPRSRKMGSDQLAVGFNYHSEIIAKNSPRSLKFTSKREEEEKETEDVAEFLASLSLQSPLKGEQAIASFIPCEEVPEDCVPEDQIPPPQEVSNEAPAGSLW